MKKEVQIEFLETQIICFGEYTEAEPQIMYDSDMSGYPGSEATFEVYKVESLSGDNITNLLHDNYLESINLICLDTL